MPRRASVTNLTGQQQPEQDGNSTSATCEAKLQVLNTTSAFSALPCLPVLPHTATHLPLQMYAHAPCNHMIFSNGFVDLKVQ